MVAGQTIAPHHIWRLMELVVEYQYQDNYLDNEFEEV